MITVGLTGGICCGKSTVTKTIEKDYNIPVVDADIIARKIVQPGTIGLMQIINTFGSEFINIDGSLNRTKLGSFVFADKVALATLDKLMKPLLIEESNNQINDLHNIGHPIVVYDAALIIEMGNHNKYRPLIVVACPRQTQIERLMKRNSMSEADAIARVDSQIPAEDKAKVADYVIDTSGTIENSVNQTHSIFKSIMSML